MSRAAISLFAGCGGFCEGMDLAGFKINVAVEIDPHAAQTYRHNFPSVPLFEGDIANFLRNGDKEFEVDDIDVVFGGPPCQGYSQIGTRDLSDRRNTLYKQFARIVELVRPRIFLMENVPNLLLLNRGHFRELICRKFESIGYSRIAILKLNAAEFGVPQTRQRVIFLGIRDEDVLEGSLQEICSAALNRAKFNHTVTVAEAIGDLPRVVGDSGQVLKYPLKTRSISPYQRLMRLDCDSKLYSQRRKLDRGILNGMIALHNHHTKEIGARRAYLISLLKPGKKADSLPKNVWNGARPEKWRRLDPNHPSYTILAQMHRDLSEWVHPRFGRWISVREAARLQSFHDGFVFKSSEWQQLKQIGNAVPPLLAYAIGQTADSVLRRLRRNKNVKHYSIAAE